MTIHYTNEVCALIPARSGSKSLPHKNIRPFCGKPLIAHSIEQALGCPEVNRVIVSTDSEEYANVALQYGAEVPFLRPAEISGDSSTDLEVFQHALRWMVENGGSVPGLLVHLRPTHPNRSAEDIGRAVKLLRQHPEWDSVRSVVSAPDPPFKMWFMQDSGELTPVVTDGRPEAHSQPRQMLPAAYLQNACVDVIRSRTILEMNSIAGSRIGAMLMSEFHDIDTASQFSKAEGAYRWSGKLPSAKTFCFDIDGVIASLVPGNDYSKATGLADNIRRINRLYGAGNHIVLFTARGYITGIDWSEITRRQLSEWGVEYHELKFGKPAADYYIDDRMVSLSELTSIDVLA